MPTRTDPWPAGTPCWVDLSVPDLAAPKEFYGAVFGWSFLDSGADLGNYLICQVDGAPRPPSVRVRPRASPRRGLSTWPAKTPTAPQS